jgi:RND family efflux transporter MFP subunit
MRLEPVYAGGAGKTAAAVPDGAIVISAEQQQLIGVRTDRVGLAPASQLLRLPGRVSVDEGRLHRIVAGAEGWIRHLGRNPAGTFVRQHEILATYYTPAFLNAQQSLFFALRTVQQATRMQVALDSERTPISVTLQAAQDALRNMGMTEHQIEELQKTRMYMDDIQLMSPITGYVIARNVSPQQRFDKGVELYQIADIGHMWVMTDIFEKDREFVRPGVMAAVRYEGREYQARMSDALPQFDPDTRTLKTRFELDNPGHVLRPGMFVDVELHVTMPAAITAPADAVIDTGRRKTVYVDLGNGAFEPRGVETGWRLGDRVQITSGLLEGERIVVAGNFLIDSESRMKVTSVSTAAVHAETVKDPVCGMDVDPGKPDAIKSTYNGKTYYFCSRNCKKSFDENPGKYVSKAAAVAIDPVCGMDVDPNAPGAIKTVHDGKTVYFCSQHCKKSFEANPAKYAPRKTSAAHAGQVAVLTVAAEKVKDPVCGMDVDPKAPDAITSTYNGKAYYFCSRHCKKSFDANPEKYLPKKSAAKARPEHDAA